MLMQQMDPTRKSVHKKVKVFQYDRHYFEVESWLDPHRYVELLRTDLPLVFRSLVPRSGLILLKTSVDTSDEKVTLPPFVTVIKEVTDDPRFSTYELAAVDSDLVFLPNKFAKD